MCQEIFSVTLATAISVIPMPEIASYRGSWGKRSCPRGATALHSVAVNWTHNLPTERQNATTELLPPQRNLLRQSLGVRRCYGVPMGSYWGTNDTSPWPSLGGSALVLVGREFDSRLGLTKTL